MLFPIGKTVGTKDVVSMDVMKLISGGLLMTASTGGGKSYLLRVLAEKACEFVPVIIFDVEGEFISLREKYPYLLLGKDGDKPINMKYLSQISQKILEMNVSVIFDLSDLKSHERQEVVKKFLETLLTMPKPYWLPRLVIVDEAQVFAPENPGKKVVVEAKAAMQDFSARGRKRGGGRTYATQRIANLDKEVAAGCTNYLIGPTFLDIDMDRAGNYLGFNKEQKQQLKQLLTGEFLATGSALRVIRKKDGVEVAEPIQGVVKIKIDKAKTTHFETGMTISSPKPASKELKAILDSFADLPQKAEEELRTTQDLKNKIRDLEHHLRTRPVAQDEKALKQAEDRGYQRHRLESNALQETITRTNKAYVQHQRKTEDLKTQARKRFERIQTEVNELRKLTEPEAFTQIAAYTPIKSIDEKKIKQSTMSSQYLRINAEKEVEHTHSYVKSEVQNIGSPEADTGPSPVTKLPKCESAIYSFLYQWPGRMFFPLQVAILTEYSYKSGGFNNALGKLNSLGLITREKGKIGLLKTDPTLAVEGDWSVKKWVENLPKCEGEIFNVLLNQPDKTYVKEELAAETPSNYSPGSGGFNNALGKLNTLGLIKRNADKTIQFNEEVREWM